MRTIFKKGNKVNVIQTGYIPGTYIHHPGGEGKIIKLLDTDEWREPLVPLYSGIIKRTILSQNTQWRKNKNGRFKYF